MTRPSRSRSRSRLCAVAAGLLSVGPLTASVAAAGAPSAVGWWWAGRPSDNMPLALSPVPAVPEGGFYVAGGLTGHSGISALRFELDPDVRAQTLTIMVADSIGSPVVDACAADDTWEAAEGGHWNERPAAACDTARVSGILAEDGTRLSFDLFAFSADENLEVVLIPGEDPASEAPPTFFTSFEPPDADTLTVGQLPARPNASTVEPSLGGGEGTTTPPTLSPAFEEGNATLSLPPAPASSPPPATHDGDTSAASPPIETTPAITDVIATEGFAYPAVLGLPLLLLVLGTYLARSLTQPVTARVGSTS